MLSASASRFANVSKATSLAGLIGLILHGSAALAADTGELDEIVVTASRRDEGISKAPYNISAYGGEALKNGNITSIAALSQQVPNFVIIDSGARNTASQVPIMRGLNVSQTSGQVDQPRLFQPAVGTYLGNAPMEPGLPLFDVERIEVLRGPQGTLYGAGTLAGAVKVVPIEPKLGVFSGSVSGSGANVSHADKSSYDAVGAVNIPMGETVALRLAGKYQYDAGFIDVKNVLAREGGNYGPGVPVLADPSNVASSAPVFFDDKGANYTRTSAARATLLFQPSSEFKVDVSFDYAHTEGVGGPKDNHTFGGGNLTVSPDFGYSLTPLNPGHSLPATGKYEINARTLEPWHRNTTLTSVDPSYDLGFATLSGTVSYGRTTAQTLLDGSTNLLGLPNYSPYYTGGPILNGTSGYHYSGAPVNPRFVAPYVQTDGDKTTTEELRLVSNGKNTFDYIVGLYFEQQSRAFTQDIYDPGIYAQELAANPGLPTSWFLVGDWPNGQLTHNPGSQKYKESAIYGNLTWHATDRWQFTGGTRLFRETFKSDLLLYIPNFGINQQTDNSNSHNGAIFMANTSYDLSPTYKAYGTWSQGYRRGGSNSYPAWNDTVPYFYLTGENPALQTYKSDTNNNFEVGIKGRSGQFYFSGDVFYIIWKDPQLDLQTPYIQYPVVVNAKEVVSKGFEFESTGPLGLPGLTYGIGIAYTHARLSQDFAVEAFTGAPQTPGNPFSPPIADPKAIAGQSGDRLPGSPDWSGSVNVNYTTVFGSGTKLAGNIGADYRGSTYNLLPHVNPAISPATVTGGYGLLHGSLDFTKDRVTYGLFGTNLANRFGVTSRNSRSVPNLKTLGGYGDTYTVVPPRTIGLRLSYNW